ncbi:MAG: hypothetical protein GWN00_37605 [Aliifodinibius sp.]|nr:hypothetical protein [Fodinibius sp.]NIY30297.1 hypothetical protein [Fodinibius sp.]
MSSTSTKDRKKIPRSILIVGIFQVAAGLWAILSMSVSGEWNLVTVLLAVFYAILGAGLLAVMEWARFIGVVVHAMILPLLLWRALYAGEAGLASAVQVVITMAIFYILTRPYIRAKFRRQSYPRS